jgi:hypothetical protein
VNNAAIACESSVDTAADNAGVPSFRVPPVGGCPVLWPTEPEEFPASPPSAAADEPWGGDRLSGRGGAAAKAWVSTALTAELVLEELPGKMGSGAHRACARGAKHSR